MLRKRIIGALAALPLLAGCASAPLEAYRGEKPELDLRTYFDGTVDAWGMFQDRSGRVVKCFYVRIDARWEGERGTLDEHFEYSDGTRQRRVWTIVRNETGRYTGTASDVVGEARGEAAGNALRWRYVMALEVDGKVYNVDFDDWMYLVSEDVMLNRSAMSKFGVRLGEVTLSFHKRRPGA